MNDGFLTRGLQLASLPAAGLWWLLHRALTGRRGAVLELAVEGDLSTAQLQVILARLRRARADHLVQGVLVWLREPPGAWAACQDLRRVLLDLRAAGKKVWVYVETPGNALTWIASAADHVWMAPTGEMSLSGVSIELTFIGSALEALGLQPEIEAAGEYKAMGEMFTRTRASPASREALQAVVDGLHAQLERDVCEGRGLPREALRAAMGRAPLHAEEALEARLVDALAYPGEARDEVEAGLPDGAKLLPFGAWASRDAVLAWLDGWGRRDRVAVVHLEGAVVLDDETGRVAVRARESVELLRELREDDAVRAVVLHVDSPGGSAFASDLVWDEVRRLADAKPVVGAFGSVAASGGYYLAAPVREIFARSTTLTGSIGVVGGKLVAADGLRRLGIVSQTVAGPAHSTLLSPFRAFTPKERARFRESLGRVYDGFVARVAAGRGRPVEEIEPHCRGRVWTGAEAHQVGLVDHLGDVFDAFERAVELGGLASARRIDLSPAVPRPWAQLVWSFLLRRLPIGTLASGPLGRQLGALEPAVALWLRHPGEALTVLPWSIRPR